MRQTLATCALIVFTVLPTCYVAVTAWRLSRPGHVRDVEIELGRKLGLQVSLGSVRYPGPGQVLYQGMVLRHEEPRRGGLAEVARADSVRVEVVDRDLIIHAEKLKLRGESPGAALGQLGTFLQQAGPVAVDRVELSAPEAILDLGGDDRQFTLREIAGEFIADPSRPTLRLAYRMPANMGTRPKVPGSGSATRCEFMLTRDRRSDIPKTLITLKTVEGLPLSARTLGSFFDADDWLGAGATVEGILHLSQSGTSEWEAEFQGSFHEVDLSQLVGHRFPRHRLTGRANVTISEARWGSRPGQAPGWTEVKGELTAAPGSIGVSLLAALSREMKFRLSPRLAQLDARKTELEYRALGLAFNISSNGEIEIKGALGDEFAPEAILAGSSTVLAAAPHGVVSVHNLIKTLFPVSDANPAVMVPLTSQSQVLLALPVPREPAIAAPKRLGGN
jgi:hypothetical protein